MIFYDLSLQKWVRSAGLTVDPWGVLTIPIGAIYELSVYFCDGDKIETPSYSDMSLVIKKSGEPTSTSLIAADATYVGGDGEIVFEIDSTATPLQTDDLTPCVLQIAYTVNSINFLTTTLEINLQNKYA